jgi:hypothetical protein
VEQPYQEVLSLTKFLDKVVPLETIGFIAFPRRTICNIFLLCYVANASVFWKKIVRSFWA